MDWIAVIAQLLSLLTADKINSNRLFDLLGHAVEKSERRWRIEPAPIYRDTLSEVLLHLENVGSEEREITTVELRLAKPWQDSPEAIGQALGARPRELPARPARTMPGGPNVPSARVLAYDLASNGRRAVVMVTGRPTRTSSAGEIEITEILIRRYYDD